MRSLQAELLSIMNNTFNNNIYTCNCGCSFDRAELSPVTNDFGLVNLKQVCPNCFKSDFVKLPVILSI
jgi:hypothetical protein